MTRRLSLLSIVFVCAAVHWMTGQPAQSQPMCRPSLERCNALDDDCDGQIDEGFAVDSACQVNDGGCPKPGRTACNDDGTGVICWADPAVRGGSRELCNGVDDDCDGRTDEDFRLGRACAVGRGACRASGVVGCNATGRGTACDAVVGVPGAEQCGNRIDDDCDGRVDEGFDVGRWCKAGVGACTAHGRKVCDPESGTTVCSAKPKEGRPELCGNRIDDDCDGSVDEGFDLGKACSGGVGACQVKGKMVCSPDRTGTVCWTPRRRPSAERCGNGVDEDCDGQVDEGFDLGKPCQAGRGACTAYGKLACARDGRRLVCDAKPARPSRELCGNGVDDNCNGRVDEGYDVGARCRVGRGACAAEGTKVCRSDAVGTVCDAQAAVPVDELCGNRIDDDCDGRVDEGFAVGGVCFAGQGICRRRGRKVCSADGAGITCNAQPGQAVDELCGNRRDDDCDAQVDEGFSLGGACEVGVGVCLRRGREVCSADKKGTGCSVKPGRPGTELCGNQRDDDCDGAVDEGFDVGGSCSSGKGLCAADGKLVCTANRKGVRCDARPARPKAELCGSGADEDCDGQIDEGFGLGTPCEVGRGACRSVGQRVCSSDRRRAICDASAGKAATELCGNGVDDDCDGRVDEGFDVGRACQQGVGACRASGKKICKTDGSGTICGAQVGTPGTEMCGNRSDDDCDGQVDEGFELRTACNVGTGVCARRGRMVCTQDGRGASCSARAGEPGKERCGNRRDDDCDGQVDEGFGVGDACMVGQGICAKPGVQACGPGGEGTVCRGRAGKAGKERCSNALDDDCDGQTDEGFDVGASCRVGVGACLSEGAKICAADGVKTLCDAKAGKPSSEACGNQIDEDCDGQLDEGFDLTAGCTVGVGACKAAGKRICAPTGAAAICDASPTAPGIELCGTRIDEDCDSSVDEGFQVGESCAVGVGGCQKTGKLVCSPEARGTICDVKAGPPAAERCGNRVDDDCDGSQDEGFDLGVPCGLGLGLCAAAGKTVCAADGRGVECGASPKDPGAELCGTGADEDCDGEVDEGFELAKACSVGVGACQLAGVTVCGGDKKGVTCSVKAAKPGAELCGNTADDDCDGQTDEGFQVGKSCTVGTRGICRVEGKWVCSPDATGEQCSVTPPQPGVELCGNRLDDDCDGRIDEGFDVGKACSVGKGLCARRGRKTCAADGAATVCDAKVAEPGVELCGTRKDEDCDGSVDEGFNVGSPCESGKGICVRKGRRVCSPDRTRAECAARPGPAEEEVCGDKQDNDCDGEIDEGFLDVDKDGLQCDNCPQVPNVSQGDLDGDDVGDACDPETLEVYVPDKGPVRLGAPAGMGLDTDLPAAMVKLKPFYIDKHEVSNSRYADCVKQGVCTVPRSHSSKNRPNYYVDPRYAHHPVVHVTWRQAEIFCRWDGKRLPSELEWEKATGAGDGRSYPWGGEQIDLYPFAAGATCERANFYAGHDCAGGDTARVGSFPAGISPFGVRDLAGNVSEWTADIFEKNGSARTVRGGSYRSKAVGIRVVHRVGRDPDRSNGEMGFRCVR